MHRNTPSSPPSTTSDQAVAVRLGTDVPFTEKYELFHQLSDTVPDQPLIRLGDKVAVSKFLVDELSTKRLEDLYWILFLVSNRRNISPLHHQAVKSRRIIITENPDLHLVWHYSRIFIKPIPLCLLTHAFWAQHIQAGSPFKSGVVAQQISLEAKGFLRTYARLILHKSDLEIAQEARLIPRHITWENWCRFIHGFRGLSDAQVSKRYHYGEIRLTRLNVWVKVFFQGWIYHEVHHNYATYFAQFITPYIFVFGGLSVVLTAFQAKLASNSESLDRATVTILVDFSLYVTLVGVGFFPTLYLMFQLRELFCYVFFYQKLE